MNEYIQEYQGYQIKPHRENPSCYIVVTAGKGGKIPDILNGMFTSRSIAKDNINRYLDTKPVKDKNNGETVGTGGSK